MSCNLYFSQSLPYQCLNVLTWHQVFPQIPWVTLVAVFLFRIQLSHTFCNLIKVLLFIGTVNNLCVFLLDSFVYDGSLVCITTSLVFHLVRLYFTGIWPGYFMGTIASYHSIKLHLKLAFGIIFVIMYLFVII